MFLELGLTQDILAAEERPLRKISFQVEGELVEEVDMESKEKKA